MSGVMTMTNTSERIQLCLAWCKAHGFPTKVVGDTVFWQTNIQTAENNCATEKLRWWDHDYFYKILKEA